MAGGFEDEWALRVGRRILAGEGVDTEADKPDIPPMLYTRDRWNKPPVWDQPTFEWLRDHFHNPPPVAEAVADEEDVEITVTPAQYEELITLRAQKEQQAELAMLRVRRQALEDDLEEAYDKLDAEKAKIVGLEQSIAYFKTGRGHAEAQRDAWMEQYKLTEALRIEAENAIDGFRESADKWRRLAAVAFGTAAGSIGAAVWGQTILAWIYS